MQNSNSQKVWIGQAGSSFNPESHCGWAVTAVVETIALKRNALSLVRETWRGVTRVKEIAEENLLIDHGVDGRGMLELSFKVPVHQMKKHGYNF